MQLIMTHEQADFDAVGAVLGACLISENSVALLPRQMNRNVQSFLNLYQRDLPFTLPGDLHDVPVDSIILVDTQSMVTIKGIRKDTSVAVFDHHQLRNDIPPAWQFTHSKTGATTSYFVSIIQEQGSHLSVIEATLLLLGIYEDTGSLTYASTSAEDARMAAFLLEQGASLKIASEFLNPPLSTQQKTIFEKLIKNAQSFQIHNQLIIVSTTDAEDLIEEISSIAHKMCDMLDPDALFIFVSTKEGIRLVARSSSDQVNVSRITANYGSGGHERAAAALIHPPDSNEKNKYQNDLVEKFIQELPNLVIPTTTVGRIMSKQPLVIQPRTSAKEALQLMQQFGYEGYPVVEKNKVIGLLTRRTVDRALAHKLNLPAISLMESGSVTALPSDSLEKLQYTMASSGWGQVPVIDPQTSEVIGIVTRTDLLKTLAGNNSYIEKINLSVELEETLPAAKLGLIQLIAAHAFEQKLPIYIVGGFVRDILLKQPSLDVDFVIEGDAIAVAHSLANRYGGKVTSHRQFGTAKWQLSGVREYLMAEAHKHAFIDPADLPVAIDLISARTEFYSYPTAMPTIKHGSIKLDLQRRDFTINTMAIRLDGKHYGELYDFWGGLNDLKKGLIRVLHSLSFVDDPTRMLRAVRFEKRLGFVIEERTIQLLKEARPLLEQVSGDRIRHELDIILSTNQCEDILARLQELGLLEQIHPDITWDTKLVTPLKNVLSLPIENGWDLPKVVANIPLRRFLAYLVLLSRISHNQIDIVAKRLHLSAALKFALIHNNRILSEIHLYSNYKPSRILRNFEKVPLVVLYAINQLSNNQKVREIIHEYVFKWSNMKPFTDGQALRTLHVPAGPLYNRLLKSLRAAWLDGEINSQTEEDVLLKELITRYQPK
jgi:tRNA nucleotidyltransferase (CCA-adding enzyme)